jgi:hypothetical protein
VASGGEPETAGSTRSETALRAPFMNPPDLSRLSHILIRIKVPDRVAAV